MDLYEKDFGSRSKWDNFINAIAKYEQSTGSSFMGDVNKLTQKIKLVLNSTNAFKKFESEPLPQYELRTTMKVKSLEAVYTKRNVGKVMVSIDISSGNFTSFNYHNPNLVLNTQSFKEMIETIAKTEYQTLENDNMKEQDAPILLKTDFDPALITYVTENKLLRQVIFGHLCPKKQQLIQKFLIGLVVETLSNQASIGIDRFIAASSDETIFVCEDEASAQIDYERVVAALKNYLPDLNTSLKVEVFKLSAIENEKNGQVAGYVKEFLFNSNSKRLSFELKAVPGYLFAQAYKRYLGLPIEENDLVFMYEGMVASLKQSFFERDY